MLPLLLYCNCCYCKFDENKKKSNEKPIDWLEMNKMMHIRMNRDNGYMKIIGFNSYPPLIKVLVVKGQNAIDYSPPPQHL